MPQDTPLPTSSPVPRLLPLVEGTHNEGVANALARLIVADETQAEMGARGALLILTGIQTFLDTGDYLAVERIWEPIILARHLERAYKDEGAKQAQQMAAALRKGGDQRGAWIYERAAVLLGPDVNKQVDSGTQPFTV